MLNILRKNNYFKISAIRIVLFEILHLLSDEFFAATVSQKIKADRYLVTFILSIWFIISPIFVSMLQLTKQLRKEWWRNDNIKLWLTNKAKLLYLSINIHWIFFYSNILNE